MQRSIDALGRIVIPKSWRNELHINTFDPVELTKHGRTIVMRKVDSSCIFCGGTDGLITHDEYAVCEKCRAAIFEKDEQQKL
ncbi:MAG: AbrB/MazE/SpoVT family DNA-binding domain-containing protein [Hydrogeniiclostridium sp.]